MTPRLREHLPPSKPRTTLKTFRLGPVDLGRLERLAAHLGPDTTLTAALKTALAVADRIVEEERNAR